MPTCRQMKIAALLPWVAAAATLAGCATLHPVPAADQPLAQATTAGVVVSVPRLDTGDYPGDVLDVSTAVLVVIENRGTSEILIDPEGFLLGPAGGAQLAAISPQQLAMKQTATPAGLPDGTLLAWRGGGGGFRVSAPPPRVGLGSPRFSVGAPARTAPAWRGGYGYRGGYYSAPRSYYYGPSRWGWWTGGPLYWGPTWGVGWYGSSLFWPWFYDGPRAYAWSRADAIRLALPAGRLPPGGRTGGFLYFPRIEQPEGTPLTLQWTVREAANYQPLGTAQIQLELRNE